MTKGYTPKQETVQILNCKGMKELICDPEREDCPEFPEPMTCGVTDQDSGLIQLEMESEFS